MVESEANDIRLMLDAKDGTYPKGKKANAFGFEKSWMCPMSDGLSSWRLYFCFTMLNDQDALGGMERSRMPAASRNI